MSIEFLFGVGDGLGTVIVGIFVALVRSWNSGYLRHYLEGRRQESEDQQDDFENLVERVDSMEKQVNLIDEKIEGDETVGPQNRNGEENIETRPS
jgi:cell division protein FtsB